MDPFTISTIVVKVTGICLSTAKTLYDIRSKFNDAPTTLATICSETTVISASLSYLQTIVCQKQELVQMLDSRPELAHALDTALIGCMVLFSCLEEETRKITATSAKTGAMSWKGKSRITWNHEKLRELLDGLRGQQLAINLLIQLVQVDSLGEIRQLLSQNQPVMTESIRNIKLLKESYPGINNPYSIYSRDNRLSVHSADFSIAGASALEFEFDDLIVNSKVYRRVLASARAKTSEHTENGSGVIEGDLIDLSDSQTIKAAQDNAISQDLECLIISRDTETTNNLPNTAPSCSTNDPGQAVAEAGPEDSGNADIQTTSTPTMRFKGSSAITLPVLEDTGSSSVDNGNLDVIETVELKKTTSSQVQFGDYYVGMSIGLWNKSKVKMGYKKDEPDQVAIKFMPRKLLKRGVARFNVFLEIAILREVSHPNVVRLLEIVESEMRVGIVLEYASNGTLFDFISSHRYLKDKEARRIFAQIVSGLEYLHLKGIAHRNLNLSNLVLDGSWDIIITAFGSAKKFDLKDEFDEDTESALTSQEYPKLKRYMRLRTNRGQPYFSAPELDYQKEDSLDANRKADIWSCGAVLYAMLVGHNPFDLARTVPGTKILNPHEYQATVPLTAPEYVTVHARDLLSRILVPDPMERANFFEIKRHSWLSA